MYAPSRIILPPPPTISSMSPFSTGTDLIPLTNSAANTAVWSVAKRVIYVPFWLEQPVTAKLMFVCNGAAVSGNLDVGLYNAAGGLPTSRIVNIGSTAQAGIGAAQSLDITDTLLQPGAYFMALTLDNTTGTVMRVNPSLLGWTRLLSVYNETTGTFGLPATATPAAAAVSSVPVFGFATVTLI